MEWDTVSFSIWFTRATAEPGAVVSLGEVNKTQVLEGIGVSSGPDGLLSGCCGVIAFSSAFSSDTRQALPPSYRKEGLIL